MAHKTSIFIYSILILYLFTGCGTKQLKPQIDDRKQEIIKAEMQRSKVKKSPKKRRFVDFEEIGRRYGTKARLRAFKLNELMNKLSNLDEVTKITKINDFFNMATFTTDKKLWGMDDFWASRMEFLGKGAGDCEDFVISKYFTLKQLGIPAKKLYLTYVKSLLLSQAHMVLSYYKTPYSIPLVLGNLKKEILPATKRKDLIPIYSFNGRALFLANPTGLGQKVPLGNERNKKWKNLIYKIQRERLR